MEARDSFIFFVRPRRFGKSLFLSMMECYYDLNAKKNFKKLFGDLWIGKNPTENANRFMTLKLDFSKVGDPVFGVPNACVERQMCDYLRDAYMPPWKDWSDWEAAARGFALRGEWMPFLKMVADNYAESVPVRGSLGGEHRLQGYHQAEFGHVKHFMARPEMELNGGFGDFFLFPDRMRFPDVPHSYIIEFKYAKAGAKKSAMEALRKEGVAQLKRYAKDRMVPVLAKGTTLHAILVLYRGSKMANCELVAERKY